MFGYIEFISVGIYVPALDSWSQGTTSSGTSVLITSANAETPGASHSRPISPTRGILSVSLSRASATSGNVTKRIAGKCGNAIDAVLTKIGRWEYSFEEESLMQGTKTARSGFCLETSASDWPVCLDVDIFPAITGSGLSTTSDLGAIFCARVSKCRVVELSPIVTKFIKSGQANLLPWLRSASKIKLSWSLFLFFALFPADRFTVDLKSPIGPRRLG